MLNCDLLFTIQLKTFFTSTSPIFSKLALNLNFRESLINMAFVIIFALIDKYMSFSK